jgi:DNA-binding HxlR family transcriptional regulator
MAALSCVGDCLFDPPDTGAAPQDQKVNLLDAPCMRILLLMKTYGQYCPLARTSELFAERWTPIVIRNLLGGCTTFTELREGAPGIPKALLVDRLSRLERYGVVERRPHPRGRGSAYALTEAGQALQSVCDAMGRWGASWLELEPSHLDPGYALWATSRLVDLALVPEPGVTIRVELGDSPVVRRWLVLFPPRAEVCTSSQGRAEDLVLRTDAGTLADYNLRRLTYREALRSGRLVVEGRRDLVRALPTWIRPSPYAQAAESGASA